MKNLNLTRAMFLIIAILGGYGAYKVLSFIYLLIIGATAEVALSGDVAVPELINNTTQAVLASVETGFARFVSAELVVIGLIALVVIVEVFWPLVSMYLPKKGGMN